MPSLFTLADVKRRVNELELDFGEYGVDQFGVRKRELAQYYTFLGFLFHHYFNVEIRGAEHIPARGRVMLVGNHSGGVALDGGMVAAALFFRIEPPRHAHAMAERFIERIPYAAQWASRLGYLTGSPEHARYLLEDERPLLVFPEGARGTAKLYGDRNSLLGFGTGFLRLALATNTPIVPFGFVGGGDAIPTIANLYRIGKRLGLPYIPITPWLLPLPRRTSLQIVVTPPMHFSGDGNEDDTVVQGMVAEVQERITSAIGDGVRMRRGVAKAGAQ